MIIQKFGGTSMGSAGSIIENVARIVQEAASNDQQPVVVVSAMSGVTNLLLQAAQTAVARKEVDLRLIKEIEQRHTAVLAALSVERAEAVETRRYISDELQNLAHLLQAITVIGELSCRTHDAVIALGEKLSANLLSCVLNVRGLAAEFVNLERVVPQELPYSTDAYWDQVEDLLKARLEQVPAGVIPVLTGFFGQTAGGMLESVGRGYSDYCAALAGAAMSVSEIQIWTDVDGVLSTNPKTVPEAFILEGLSFDEMAELSHFGAKVLHPFSVRPAVKAGIPLRILNTFNSKLEGTVVQEAGCPSKLPFKSITCVQGVSVIRVTTPRMLLAHGYMAKITEVFARHRIIIDLIATSEVSVSFTVAEKVTEDSALVHDLQNFGEVSLQSGQSIVSIVGAEMKNGSSILGRVFQLMDRNGIKVNMASFGNAMINLSFVLSDADCSKAVRLLHQEFFGASR